MNKKQAPFSEPKRHYKLYKAGKKWLIAGMTTVAIGAAAAFEGTGVTARADVTSKTDTADSQSVTTAVNEATTGKTTVLSSTPATIQTETNDNQKDKSSETQAPAMKNVETKAPSTSAQTPVTEKQTNLGNASSNQVNATKQQAATDYQTTKQPQKITAVAETASQAPATLTSNMTEKTVDLGSADVATVQFNTTGIDTSYDDANLTVQLSKGAVLLNDLNELSVGGIVPVYTQDDGTLSYDFGTLAGGISANLALNLKADKQVLKAGDTISATSTFNANQKALLTALATATVNPGTFIASVTNNLIDLTPGDPTKPHDNPTTGDTVTLGVGYTLNTADEGAALLKEDSDVILQYKLAKGLTYVGLASVDGLEADTPVVTTDTDGNTVLTWTKKAGDLASQTAENTTYKYAIQVSVDADVANFTMLDNDASLMVTTNDGRENATKPVTASFMTSPYDPTVPISMSGSTFPSGSWGALDGFTNTNKNTANVDPTVKWQTSPLLATTSVVTSNMYGAQIGLSDWMSATKGMLSYLAMHEHLSKGESLQRLTIAQAYYNPNYGSGEVYGQFDDATGLTPLTNYPYLTLAVKYADDEENEYHVLATDVTTNEQHIYNRKELVSMGLDTTKTVVDVFAYYHMDENGADLPDDPDTFYADTDGDGQSNLNTADLPEDAGAPIGIMQAFNFVTSVNEGFTGTITHQYAPQFGVAYGLSGGTHVMFASVDDLVVQDPNIVPDIAYWAPKTVEVVSAQEGVQRVLKTDVWFSDTTSAGQLTEGTHQLRTQITSDTASQANLVWSDDGVSTYILLPTGVSYNASETQNAEDVSVVDTDYQGTGQQLVKLQWNQTGGYLTPGAFYRSSIGVDVTSVAPKTVTFNAYTDFGDIDYQVPDASNPDAMGTNQKVIDSTDINGNGVSTDQLDYVWTGYNTLKTQKLQAENTAQTDKLKPGDKVTLTAGTTADTDANLTKLDMIVSLPTVGDTGLTTNVDRNSDFTPALSGPVILPTDWQDKVTVQYTTDDVTSADPSTATWVDEVTAKADWSAVKAFRVSYSNIDTTLAGGQQQVSYTLQVPSIGANYTGDGSIYHMTSTLAVSANGLLVTEPNATTITVQLDKLSYGTVQAKRTIHYTGADTSTPEDVVQTVTYKYVTDETTGDSIYTPTGYFKNVKSPELAGYTVDKAEVKQVLAQATTEKPEENVVETVKYTKQVNPVYTPTTPGSETGTTETDLTHNVTVTTTYGTPVNATDTDMVTFYRTATVDLSKTPDDPARVTYTSWTTNPDGDMTKGTATVTLAPLTDLRTPANYRSTVTTTVDGNNAGENPALTLTPTNEAITRTVTYKVNTPAGNGTDTPTETIPETGDNPTPGTTDSKMTPTADGNNPTPANKPGDVTNPVVTPVNGKHGPTGTNTPTSKNLPNNGGDQTNPTVDGNGNNPTADPQSVNGGDGELHGNGNQLMTPVAKVGNNAPTASADKTGSSEAQLPQTSEPNDAKASVAGLGLLAAVLGLFGLDVKRRRN